MEPDVCGPRMTPPRGRACLGLVVATGSVPPQGGRQQGGGLPTKASPASSASLLAAARGPGAAHTHKRPSLSNGTHSSQTMSSVSALCRCRRHPRTRAAGVQSRRWDELARAEGLLPERMDKHAAVQSVARTWGARGHQLLSNGSRDQLSKAASLHVKGPTNLRVRRLRGRGRGARASPTSCHARGLARHCLAPFPCQEWESMQSISST